MQQHSCCPAATKKLPGERGCPTAFITTMTQHDTVQSKKSLKYPLTTMHFDITGLKLRGNH
jgi:hypothetical protein